MLFGKKKRPFNKYTRTKSKKKKINSSFTFIVIITMNLKNLN